MRLFVAIDIPKTVKQELERLQHALQQSSVLTASYPQSDVMHLTLQFIGDVDESVVPVIQERLTHIAVTHDYAHLDGIDIFMKRQKITVIFVRVAARHLALLAQQINKQLHDFVEPESKPFVGHLTLARVKAVEDRERLLDFLGTLAVEPVRFPIREFVLKQSVLSAQGPLHTDVQVYPLLPP